MRIRERIPERSGRVIRLARSRSDRIEGKPKRPAAAPPATARAAAIQGHPARQVGLPEALPNLAPRRLGRTALR